MGVVREGEQAVYVRLILDWTFTKVLQGCHKQGRWVLFDNFW